MAVKTGSLSKEELLAIWQSCVDPDYAHSLKTAGDGNGYEVPSQSAEQWARISEAVEVSTQALYILPWSGQTREPAGGERKATVTLTFARTKHLEQPLVLGAGLIYAEEETDDYGENEAVAVRTGRRYLLTEDLVFHPGESGPFTVVAEAERPGWGYNNPLPGTIKALSQPGEGFNNDQGDVTSTPAATPAQAGPYRLLTMIGENQPDMPIPEHVGQYMFFVSGTNIGKFARMTTFIIPDPDNDLGSGVRLEQVVSFQGTPAGVFQPGEIVTFGASGFGRVLGARGNKLTCVMLNGTTAATITGTVSGATLTSATVIYGPSSFATEANVSWRIMSWDVDFGLTVTNVLSPSGGRLGVLDAIGDERNIKRASGETDDVYRLRVASVADTVAPNAIKRALNKALGSIPYCYREAINGKLPGFFFDAEDAFDYFTIAFAGDMDGVFAQDEEVVLENIADGRIFMFFRFGRLDGLPLGFGVTYDVPDMFPYDEEVFYDGIASLLTLIYKAGALPADMTGLRLRGRSSGATMVTISNAIVSAQAIPKRYNVWLDYEQMRAFFIVGLPTLPLGEFGFAYDVAGLYPYDSQGTNLVFFDGYAPGAANVHRRVQQTLEDVRAGGVGYELRKDDNGC